MTNPLNGPQVRDAILKKGYEATEAGAFFWGNTIEALANTGKSALTAQFGSRVGSGAYKTTKNFTKGDLLCGTLCSISIGCEIACGVIIWLPVPGKFTSIAVLKSVSHGTTKFRDLCAGDPSNPFC